MSLSKNSTEDPPPNAQRKSPWAWGVIIVVFILLALFAFQAGLLNLPSLLLSPPELGGQGQSSSLWLVFLTGLTAGGLSCLAVQGGLLATTVARREQLVLQEKSQSTGHATPILLFLAAKLVAYTLLGALLGLFGSWISLSTTMRGWLQILIGLFMLGMALQMLNVHPIFRYLVIQPPKGLQRFVRKSSKADDAFTPLFLGALTVFIPCGVTQAIALLALGAGSATQGALIMFAFVLGTFPIFFVLGLATARLSSLWEGTFMQVAAIAILVMALYSIIGGSRLLGYQIGLGNPIEMADSAIVATPIRTVADELTALTEGINAPAGGEMEVGPDGYQQVTIAAMNEGYQPQLVKLRAGVPARINLVTNETYSCARAFVIPALGVEKFLPATGTETIEFTPEEPGSIPFTCSMGMYTGVIEVVANDRDAAEAPAAPMATQATEMEHKEMTHEAATPSEESQQVPAQQGHGRILLTASEQDRMQVFIMNSDGTGLERLTDGPDENIHPTISPDGAWLAYTSRHEGNLDITLMNMENNEVKQLTSDPSPDFQPRFSPDGSQIAFISERDGDPDIWLMNRDGSGLTQLLDRPEEQHLGAWSPDGRTIVFVDHQQERSAGSDRSTIWKMTLADGTLRKLTDLGSINDAPVFSPDGERVAFYSNRTGDFNIFTMAADGSDIKQLTHDAQKAINPIYSPDGNRIIYGQLGGESIQQIPSTGGQPSTLTTSPEIQALPTGWVTTSHQ